MTNIGLDRINLPTDTGEWGQPQFWGAGEDDGLAMARGRPFYSNDVIWLHQVTVPLYQGTVLLSKLYQI